MTALSMAPVVALIAAVAVLDLLPRPRHHLRTTLVIDAAPRVVWRILTRTECYPRWNPLVRELEGRLEPGRRIRVTLRMANGQTMGFTPEVVAFEPDRELEWLGHLGLPGLFDGRHRFALLAMPTGKTRLIHEEHFSGLLVPLLRRPLERLSLPVFRAMNLALKARAESVDMPEAPRVADAARATTASATTT